MLFVVECASLVVYAVTILLAFVFGLARGKRARKVIIHFIFFSLIYMIVLCWIGMTSAWNIVRPSDGERIDMVRFTKNVVFSSTCVLIVTNIINKFSAYTIIHGLNFAFAYFSLYNAMLDDLYEDRLTWLEISCVLSIFRFFYLLKEIIDGKRYNPIIAKVVVGFNIAYDILYYMVFIMSPYFQNLISFYSMNVVMSVLDLVFVPLCALIVVHYNWISMSQDYSNQQQDYLAVNAAQRKFENEVASGKISRREVRDAFHSH
ncbi:MAG: hypothetical protein BVN35_17730 [Proteobacteria bacterium ST_bin11]|nr:MAG: hypothetical protein BVN35_17730 [Proteobacteria bacterium ST_bin11]